MGHGSQREINYRGAADVKKLRASPATETFRGVTFDGRGADVIIDGDGGGEGDIARDHAGIPPGRGAAGEVRESRDRGRGQEPGPREELAERLLGLAGVVQRGCSALPIQEVAHKRSTQVKQGLNWKSQLTRAHLGQGHPCWLGRHSHSGSQNEQHQK